jgi:NADH-quinone oxidoreductase subunit G
MVTIFVDGTEHEVREGQNLLQAVLGLGYDLPYFCWHPALGSVGACRQCAVKQFRSVDDATGVIVMACMTPVTAGLRISIVDPDAAAFRSSVIEWLMTNHPHDCPICDEGGECHLQDMTVMTGHDRCEHRFAKRTHRNQDLGPFLNHEMNRCIQCYRCVRFYRDYAGGDDLNVFGSRNRVYFGRAEDGTLESPFSGNLAEVCPTGVFTDKVFKSRAVRPWDLQTAPSICVHCGLGCNTLPGERNGVLRRIRNRYHGEVNRYFLCDRGRFGFEFVNSPRRLRHPVVGRRGAARHATRTEAVELAASLIGEGGVMGIGSPTASLESNHALRRLVGDDRFFMGIGPDEAEALRTVAELATCGPTTTPSLRRVELADAVLILGEDPTNAAPLLDLAIRQALLNAPKQRVEELGIPDWNDAVVRLIVNRRRGPLIIVTPTATPLDGVASIVHRAAPEDIAGIAHAVADRLSPDGPGEGHAAGEGDGLVSAVADALRHASAPLVVAGSGQGEPAIILAAARVAECLSSTHPSASLFPVVADCNSVGAVLLGAGDLADAAKLAARDDIRTVIVLEPDETRRDRAPYLAAVFDSVAHRLVLDLLDGAGCADADLVLPIASFAESGGTLVNNEARAQRFFQVFIPTGEILPGWRWIQLIGERMHGEGGFGWARSHDVAVELADAQPIFDPIRTLASAPSTEPRRKVPRQSHRVSGRTALNAHREIHEPRPPDDDESPLAYSMEGSPLQPPSALVTRYWAPGWNSVQALTKFQEEIGGSLRGGDPGVKLRARAGSRPREAPDRAPQPFQARPDEWRLVPVIHLFGSEPRSLETPGVKQLAPPPTIALRSVDGARLGAAPGELLVVEIDGRSTELPFRPDDGLPEGCAGLPVTLPDAAALSPGRWAKIGRRS